MRNAAIRPPSQSFVRRNKYRLVLLVGVALMGAVSLADELEREAAAQALTHTGVPVRDELEALTQAGLEIHGEKMFLGDTPVREVRYPNGLILTLQHDTDFPENAIDLLCTPGEPLPSLIPFSELAYAQRTEARRQFPSPPVAITFHRNGARCPLYPVGLQEDNAIGTMNSADCAAWFSLGAIPGAPGNAILSGHEQFQGKRGVFSILHETEPGDLFTIAYEDGSLRVFEAVSHDTYRADDFPAHILRMDVQVPRLTLFTCTGDYDETGFSASRDVVICREIEAA